MKITGIITEYNPFHNGHLYHLKKTKDNTGGQGTLCIMNGNFMQRGAPAMIDKWSRAEMAIKNGVDLILELPLFYGIRSAEYFASGALNLLEKTGCVDSFVFGSESGNLGPLSQIANILVQEPDYYRQRLHHYLQTGKPFPGARQRALIEYLTRENGSQPGKEIHHALKKPNNILGIEYLKTIRRDSLSLKPVTIKRKGGEYHEKKTGGRISSATAIRKKFYSSQGNTGKIERYIPDICQEIITEKVKNGFLPLRKEYLGIMILSQVRKMGTKELQKYAELRNGLENRLLRYAQNCGSLTELLNKTKTRAFTWTRIQRNLLHILFRLREKDFIRLDKAGPQYFRVLGFNKTGRKILNQIKKSSDLPLITQPADFLQEVEPYTEDPLRAQLSLDIMATDLYSLLYRDEKCRTGRQDFYRPVIKI